MLSRMRVNWSVFFLAVVFSLMANRYFGWNWKPESDAELICDGIVFLLAALSFMRSPRRNNAAK